MSESREQLRQQLEEQQEANAAKFSEMQRLHNFSGFPPDVMLQARLEMFEQFVIDELGGDAGLRWALMWERAFADVLLGTSRSLTNARLQLPGQLNLDGKEVR